ncbi:MAG: TetR/AcrR family transcriptional regulator [Bacillota bacterium]
MDLAIKLVQQKGYVGFSYDDISKQLGVTKASIHYQYYSNHFRNIYSTTMKINFCIIRKKAILKKTQLIHF